MQSGPLLYECPRCHNKIGRHLVRAQKNPRRTASAVISAVPCAILYIKLTIEDDEKLSVKELTSDRVLLEPSESLFPDLGWEGSCMRGMLV